MLALVLQAYGVPLKFAKSTIQRYANSRVDVGDTKLRCAIEICKVYHTKIQGLTRSLKFATSLPYKDTKNQGWTLALQTYTAREIGNVYHTTIPKLKGGC